MAKARKTREQKIKADLKRIKSPAPETGSSVQYQIASVIETTQPAIPVVEKRTQTTGFITDYKYLSKDLMKTVITVGIVLLIEIILRMVIHTT